MSKISYAQNQVGKLLSAGTGMSLFDLPDFDWDNWVEEDMTQTEIDNIAPDILWEMLDNHGMERDIVNRICYPGECEDQ